MLALKAMSSNLSLRIKTLAALLRAGARHTSFVENEVVGLGELIKPGDVCFDIGGEYGLYTWTFAALTGPTGAVHCVEAQPNLAKALARHARWLGAHNVTIHNLALSNRIGEGHLSQPQRHGLPVHGRTFLADDTSGLGSNVEFAAHHNIDVQVDTLDDFVEHLGLERLDFIKADIEGAEARLLAGGEQTLSRFHPVLLIELEDRHLERFGTDVATIVQWLATLGYQPFHWQWESENTDKYEFGEAPRKHQTGSWQPGIQDRNVLFMPSR